MALLTRWRMLSIFVSILLWMTGIDRVEAAPVMVDVPADIVLNQAVTVTCSVDTTTTPLTYQWLESTIEIPSGQVIQSDSSNEYRFSSIGIADVGNKYACVVIDGAGTEIGRTTFALNATVPDFTWRTINSPTGNNYVGQRLNVTCLGFLGDTTGLTVNSTILDPQNESIPAGMEGDRVRVYELMKTSAGYETTLQLSPLSASDEGIYKCTGTIMPVVANSYITNGVGTQTFDITLTSVILTATVTVTTPLTRLLDSEPYNELTLTCTSEARVRVQPVAFNVNFTWFQSVDGGPMLEVSGGTGYGSQVTHQLPVNVSEAGSHTYLCRVSLDLRPATDVKTAERTAVVTVYGPSPPAAPVNLNTPVIRHDTVSVAWDVPVVTYDPETYVIRYGTEETALNSVTDAVMGRRVELTGLLVSTQYYYSVEASNSNGTTASVISTFTTTTSPPQPPRSLMYSRDATNLTVYHFTWELDQDPQGVVTKQKVTCTSDDAPPLSVEVGRSATSATLTNFRYREQYVCSIRAASSNNIYSAANGNITIIVSEDVPEQVECGIDNMETGRFWGVYSEEGVQEVNVSVKWSPPANPQGILHNYSLTFTDYVAGRVIQHVVVNGNITMYIFTNLTLEAGVPYNVTVVASNSVATSKTPCYITDFIKQLAPPPVMDLKLERSSGTDITVTWTVPSLVVARGFVDYILEYGPATNRRKRQTSSASTCTSSPCTVPASRGQAVITGLDPKQSYTVSVSPVNQDGVPGTLMSDTAESFEPAFPLLAIIIAVVAGTILLGVVILIILIVVCCCCLRRTRSSKTISASNPYDQMELNHKETDVVLHQDLAPAYSISQPPSNTLSDRSKPIPMDELSARVKILHENRDKLFDAEYDALGNQSSSASDIAKMNKSKNRFQNIHPYDFSRVQIEPIDGIEGSDYVNASYIDGYGRPNAYIAAQGPMVNTVGDFWRMVYEHKITTIVMLTKFNEGGKRKCEPYWPECVGDKEVQKETSLEITFKELMPFADFEIRKFEVRNISDEDGCEVRHVITHYQFLGWPDHGVPKFATSLIQFIRRVKRHYDGQVDKSKPLLVHCSAGVGRTGTYITLDAMLDRMKAENTIAVFDFVRNMRAKRVHMVQAMTQYVFIHDALEELITCGDTSVEAPYLRDVINTLNIVNPHTTNTGFEDQFELLKRVSRVLTNADRSDALQHYNERKNRFQGIVPNNQSRVKLRTLGDPGSDYINASFVDGYKRRNAYIATQAPLETTVLDFWRMIWEFNSRAVVLLGPLQDGHVTIPMFWPEKEGSEEMHGRFLINLKSERPVKGYIERKIHIQGGERTPNTSEQGFTVTLYHYDNWEECGRPLTPGSILHLITSLGHVQRNTGNKCITVMCSNGTGRTGCFLTIHAMIERANTENVVDVFQFIKSSRVQRPDLVVELEHYRFCHDVLADYIENNKSYANFRDIPSSTPGPGSRGTPPVNSTYSHS